MKSIGAAYDCFEYPGSGAKQVDWVVRVKFNGEFVIGPSIIFQVNHNGWDCLPRSADDDFYTGNGADGQHGIEEILVGVVSMFHYMHQRKEPWEMWQQGVKDGVGVFHGVLYVQPMISLAEKSGQSGLQAGWELASIKPQPWPPGLTFQAHGLRVRSSSWGVRAHARLDGEMVTMVFGVRSITPSKTFELEIFRQVRTVRNKGYVA